MSEVINVVDHLRFNYTGPFDAKQLFRHLTAFVKERGFDIKIDKDFEQNTKSGKQIEWQIDPWKKISDYLHYWIKMRVYIHDYQKVDRVVDGKTIKVGHGKCMIYIDGYTETDYYNQWEATPHLQFIRMLYNRFVFKQLTYRYEQQLTHDCYHLYNTIEQFFNAYKTYQHNTQAPPWVSV